MNDQARLALIDRLRAQSGEQEWFEFKRNYYEPQALGEYVSALAKGRRKNRFRFHHMGSMV